VNYNIKLRNSPLYILTEDLSFFYRINKELNKLKIPFKILNLNKIITRHSNLILTTSAELKFVKGNNNESIILAYSSDETFDNYIIKVLAAVRIGYKHYYSNLLFSVDPGKRTGLMIFLDDFYLYSYCCFKPAEVIYNIIRYIECFQKENPNPMNISIKLGNGVYSIIRYLIEKIYQVYEKRKNLEILLIDEFRSSKIKISQKKKPYKLSKDEFSALILALRSGIEVDQDNYLTILNQYGRNWQNGEERILLKSEKLKNHTSVVGEIALKIVDGELSLNSASEELKRLNLLK